MKISNGICLLALLTTVGCSVQTQTALNEPPSLQGGVTTFASQFGTIQPRAFSVFLWPQQDEAKYTETVTVVSRASMAIDRLSVALVTSGFGMKKLAAEFEQLACVKDWADLALFEQQPEWVSKWKAGAPEACEANQNQRKKLAKQIEQIRNLDIPVQAGTLFKAIDPGYPDLVENNQSVNAADSRVTLNENGMAAIVLKDFRHKGQHFEVPGKYDSNLKRLSFAVPELDPNGAKTGRVWAFQLERAPDFLQAARFVGDIGVLSQGKLVRTGSVKIEGELK